MATASFQGCSGVSCPGSNLIFLIYHRRMSLKFGLLLISTSMTISRSDGFYTELCTEPLALCIAILLVISMIFCFTVKGGFWFPASILLLLPFRVLDLLSTSVCTLVCTSSGLCTALPWNVYNMVLFMGHFFNICQQQVKFLALH